jgi:hypothetical protein
VTNSGASAYTINGNNNPTINLIRGFTYYFSVNASGHPFWIKTSQVTGIGNAYTSGITNNGTQVGTITFTVPLDAPSTLYYICQFHSSMAGQFNISDLGPTGATGPSGPSGATGPGGGGVGSLTATYIAYGKTDGSITGTNRLVYNSTADTIRLGDPAATTYITIGHGESSASDGTNLGIGYQALNNAVAGGINNIAIGYLPLWRTTTGDNNLAIGYESGLNNTTGNDSTFIGHQAGKFIRGSNNTAIGSGTLFGSIDPSTGSNNTALGYNASNSLTGFNNTTALGANSAVSGSNQVQLGDNATATYAYGAIQNRSDQRDKADIRDTQLGLDFVLALRPVDYKWDMREDYKPARPDINKPELPTDPAAEQTAEYNTALESYNSVMTAWQESVKMSNLIHDGSKIRTRYHHGLIAQEVKSVMDNKGIDFGGYQDHSVKGGEDVLSLGYSELIAPLIKAIQELNAKVDALAAKVNT